MYLISLNVRCLALKHSKAVGGPGSCCECWPCHISALNGSRVENWFILNWKRHWEFIHISLEKTSTEKSQNLRKIKDKIIEQRLPKMKVVTPNPCLLSSYTILISLGLLLILANLFYCFAVVCWQNTEYFYDSSSVSTSWTATIVWVAKHFQFD